MNYSTHYYAHYITSLSEMTVTAEFPVSVTNEEQTIEWKEQGLILHVPKDSLPPGCKDPSTQVTMFIAEPAGMMIGALY